MILSKGAATWVHIETFDHGCKTRVPCSKDPRRSRQEISNLQQQLEEARNLEQRPGVTLLLKVCHLHVFVCLKQQMSSLKELSSLTSQ